jgi:hypothetical protein
MRGGRRQTRSCSGPGPSRRSPRYHRSWWAFLRGELIAVGGAAVAIPAWMALSQERRDWLMRLAPDLLELVHLARGHP